MISPVLKRLSALILLCGSLAACTNPNDLDRVPVPLGDFALGHNIVVAPNLTKGPLSRDATKEEWIASMQRAVDERFQRYEGEKFYHLGISVEGYVLAVPGVPLVASPKSALIINVTAWDDAAGRKLHAKPEQITIVESISAPTLLSSGLTQSKEVQMRNLSRNAAKLIQNWLRRQHINEGWFGPPNPEAEARAEAALRAAQAAQAEAEAAVAAEKAAAEAEAAEDGSVEETS